MTSILTTNDVLKVSIFRCKVCDLRLHNPIMQVEAYGNICGSCFHKSVYTNTTQNEEMEELLLMLYVPCRYVGRGCTFDGFYSKMLEHERICYYTEILCPLSYEQKCDDYLYIKNIVSHIREKHTDNVLIKPLAPIPNPTEQRPKRCYLFDVNGELFLLKINLNVGKQHILYNFYHFNNDNSPGKNDFPFIIKYGDSVLTINRGTHIMHVTNFMPQKGFNDTWVVKLKMKFLNHYKYLLISAGVSDNIPFVEDNVLCKCHHCLKVVNKFFLCTYCAKLVCVTCKHIHRCGYTMIDISTSGISSRMQCENEGCSLLINGSEYYLHKDYFCDYKKFECPFKDVCNNWLGSLKALRSHVLEVHQNYLNQSLCQINLEEKSTLYFIKENDFFVQSHYLKKTGELTVTTIKLTAPYYDSSYTWEVHVKRNVIADDGFLIFGGDCTLERQEQTLNVTKYVENVGIIAINTFIKRK